MVTSRYLNSQHPWVGAKSWEEAAAVLKTLGKNPLEIFHWIKSRRHALRESAERLCNGAALQDADHWHISGVDHLGDWSFRPADLLQPIDYHELQPVLDAHPIDRDLICKAVLESRLIHSGHAPGYAKWAVDLLPWCCQSAGESFAPSVEGRWDEYADALAARIAEKRKEDKAAAADAKRKLESEEFISPADVPKLAKKLGHGKVDYCPLLKIHGFPDNGQKGKGKRKLLRSAVIQWLNDKYGSPAAEAHTNRQADNIMPECRRRPPLEKIVAFLTTNGPATPLIIAFNIDLSEDEVWRWLKESQDVVQQGPDEKWSLK